MARQPRVGRAAVRPQVGARLEDGEKGLAAARKCEAGRRLYVLDRGCGGGAARAVLRVLATVAKERQLAPLAWARAPARAWAQAAREGWGWQWPTEGQLATLARSDQRRVVLRAAADGCEGAARRTIEHQRDHLATDRRVALLEQLAPREVGRGMPRLGAQLGHHVWRALHRMVPQPRGHAGLRDLGEPAPGVLIVGAQLLQAVHAVDHRADVLRLEAERRLEGTASVGEERLLHQHLACAGGVRLTGMP